MPGSGILRCGDRALDLSRTIIMGVLNVTPDSFSDGGRFLRPDDALRQAERMAADGAEIIDVGGESTRPGSDAVSAQQEMDRVVPIIQELRDTMDVVISVDTAKPEVMTAALAAGAGLVNDVNALRTPGAVEVVAQSQAAVCLMHMLGTPKTMQTAPRYENVVMEVRDFLHTRVTACRRAGIPPERILCDPGFGFGKTVDHNLALLRELNLLAAICPVVVGLSRKSMIRKLLDLGMDERVHASVALAQIAVANGASIVRVHDVEPTVAAVRMYECVYPDRGRRLTPTSGSDDIIKD